MTFGIINQGPKNIIDHCIFACSNGTYGIYMTKTQFIFTVILTIGIIFWNILYMKNKKDFAQNIMVIIMIILFIQIIGNNITTLVFENKL